MPITRDTMAHTPYLFSNFSGFQAPKVGTHTRFAAAAVRTTYVTAPQNSGLELTTFTKDPAGDTIYLSYFTNEISSVRLPNPPPAGVTTFTTDNLSGCKVFVDTIAGSNDVIVYHAGTALVDGELVTAGGRVLGVTGLGDDLSAARDAAYRAVEKIDWPGGFYRSDIGWRALKE